MKRPFVVVVSFYAFGLMLAEWVRPPLVLLFAASFLMLFLALTIAKWRPILLCMLLVLIGWANLIFHTAINSPNDLRKLIGDQTEFATVRGVLVRTPQIRISERRGAQIERSQAQVRVTEIQLDQTWQPADADIIVSTPLEAATRTVAAAQTTRKRTTAGSQTAPVQIQTSTQTAAAVQSDVAPAQMVAPVQTGGGTNAFAGQLVEISGTIMRPPTASAEGLFDDREYLQTRGIFYELRTRSPDDWQLRDPTLSRPPLTDRFLNWSRRVMALGLPEDQTLRLLWAMTLGWRTAFTGDVGDPYLRAGTIVDFVSH